MQKDILKAVCNSHIKTSEKLAQAFSRFFHASLIPFALKNQ